MSKEILIEDLKFANILKSHSIEQALKELDRMDFVLPRDKQYAYHDKPFSIGYNQSISQPMTVVFMLELLDVKEGNNVMEIGYGSGWQTGLLAYLVGEEGKIHAIEIISALCNFGKENLSKYPHYIDRIEFHCKNATKGLPDEAERIGGFDRIIAAAELREVPEFWKQQLKIGGILVYPRNGSIYRENKISAGEYESSIYRGFSFVPYLY